jgi:hypothetical protein
MPSGGALCILRSSPKSITSIRPPPGLCPLEDNFISGMPCGLGLSTTQRLLVGDTKVPKGTCHNARGIGVPLMKGMGQIIGGHGE